MEFHLYFNPTIVGICSLVHLFTCSLVCLFIGWRVGASFDSQSCIELEAILKKLDFNKPSMASLNDFSVFS